MSDSSALRVLVTGSPRGQLYHELCRSVPATVTLVQPVDRLDITDREAVLRQLLEAPVDVIVNTAAYTQVDQAENDHARARSVNVQGVEHLLEAASRSQTWLVQVSTDFVFGGDEARPRTVVDEPRPLSIYAATKREAEKRVLDTQAERAAVVRTGWLYSSHGANFVKSMLALMQTRNSLKVVVDQIGAPTWAASLAQAIWRIVDRRSSGIHHWSGAGVASWYDFAVAIQEEALQRGLLERAIPVVPIPTSEYPTSAMRPAYSVLHLADTWSRLDMQAEHWRVQLRRMLEELA